MMQVLREWPPGFGGVERVAHGLASELGGSVFSLRPSPSGCPDPLSVSYQRYILPSTDVGRVLFPLPSRPLLCLITSREPLLVHLPCPTVLVLLLLARVCRPRRVLRVYWHAFLAPRAGVGGWLEALYQTLALRGISLFPVLTTSPQLVEALQAEGVARVQCLPCALPPVTEAACTAHWQLRDHGPSPTSRSVIAIGRLESYKRIDWLIEAVAAAPAVQRLEVIGDGPDRSRLEALARGRLRQHQQAVFWGRLAEAAKLERLASAAVLVLPADRCNEAFGIVQLEAMACGVPALAYDLPRSGMHGVSALPALPWSGQPADLAALLQRLLSSPNLQRLASTQARARYDCDFALECWRCRVAQLALGDG
jgi:glycosyltransferase involved in cell wall biosynthesis